ncbi:MULTISPECIES: class I SAM-dependent methyltransferase [Bacillaceae]|uniref:Methyltransferase n=1 Tax=Gottfriedia luciferensis TaxID=178774 RepID=A0ABX2ZLV6_9BACI|nr:MULTISPECIES: class I SAM-dependent methyltransferase [Bacillaceae]ODG90221.1 methyltransferase [Gottfriedia luciferensis]PGZ93664.1 class I SAM-dependent methyltransferase [Bacillus sp. AFS029533]SFC99185.1 Methyltransferase domain-containing protein [Bacillus sp. UNCCL81]
MTYNRFAYLYDQLMNDVPYERWVQFLEDVFQKYEMLQPSILDIGCGTGTLPISLAKLNYSISGVDLSEEMLSVAMAKAELEKVNIPFFQQNMVELEGFNQLDCVTIFCDSLNYLETEDQVKQTFIRVNESLKDNGLFLFDVHSPYKIEEIFGEETFFIDDAELSLVWSCTQGEHPLSVEHDLVFFMKEENRDLYERFEEYHNQRTFPINTYTSLLNQTGFEVKEIIADFDEAVDDTSERIFFIAMKK